MKQSILDCKLYSYMETAVIVYGAFRNVLDQIEDAVYSESDCDTYETLIGIAIEIENENQRNGGDYAIEDIREKAEPMILQEYGVKKVVQISVDIAVDDNDNITAKDIETALTESHYDVMGAEWKATWNSLDSYEKGFGPDSND